MSHSNSNKELLSRRDALKTLAAITGAATLAGLPGKWETPIIQVGALPAHAACSFEPGATALELTNGTGGTFDVTVYDNSENMVCSGVLAPGESLCCTNLEAGFHFYDGRVDGVEGCEFAFGEMSLSAGKVTKVTAVCETNQVPE